MGKGDMFLIWHSLSWHLKDRMRTVDQIVATLMNEMDIAGVPKKEYLPYMKSEIERMIDEIAAQRERETLSERVKNRAEKRAHTKIRR